MSTGSNLPAVGAIQPTPPTTTDRKTPRSVRASKRVVRRFRGYLSGEALNKGNQTLYDSLETILADPEHKQFATVLKIVLEYGIGSPTLAMFMGDRAAADDPDKPDLLRTHGPVALPALTTETEMVREIYDEQGNLVKRFGKKVVKQHGRPEGQRTEPMEAEIVEDESSSL